jgi:hypothetical protein
MISAGLIQRFTERHRFTRRRISHDLLLNKLPGRVAAAQTIVKPGAHTKLKVLVNHINAPNLLIGIFTLEAIKDTVVNDAFSPSVPVNASAQTAAYFH